MWHAIDSWVTFIPEVLSQWGILGFEGTNQKNLLSWKRSNLARVSQLRSQKAVSLGEDIRIFGDSDGVSNYFNKFKGILNVSLVPFLIVH